jgi:hypothetical protein
VTALKQQSGGDIVTTGSIRLVHALGETRPFVQPRTGALALQPIM